MDKEQMVKKAADLRLDILNMIMKAGSGHIGGSFSAIDILVALYYSVMSPDAGTSSENRDRFVLSKGHAAPALYAVLIDKGLLPKEELDRLRAFGSPLQGHPDSRKCPGIDCSTGSLGQGISVAVGMALGLKRKGSPARVYALVGDGELQEGICWEAFMAANQFKLDNLTVIIDDNRLQLSGFTEEIISLSDLNKKMSDFGFSAVTVDGHDFDSLVPELQTQIKDKPRCIIAETIKGKGVSFMENAVEWHGNLPKGEQIKEAFRELGGEYNG